MKVSTLRTMNDFLAKLDECDRIMACLLNDEPLEDMTLNMNFDIYVAVSERRQHLIECLNNLGVEIV